MKTEKCFNDVLACSEIHQKHKRIISRAKKHLTKVEKIKNQREKVKCCSESEAHQRNMSPLAFFFFFFFLVHLKSK